MQKTGTPPAAMRFFKGICSDKRGSIDYAVLEHAAEVAVIEAPFTWDDLGGCRLSPVKGDKMTMEILLLDVT